mgnify:CR=1 FL=1
MVPVLPLPISVGKTQGPFVEDKDVTLATQGNSASAGATYPGNRFGPIGIIVLFGQGPPWKTVQIDEVGDSASVRDAVGRTKAI